MTRLAGRQCEEKYTAVTRQPITLDANLPSQFLDDAAHDRETESMARGAGLIQMCERRKHLSLCLRRNPIAVVAHPETDAPIG